MHVHCLRERLAEHHAKILLLRAVVRTQAFRKEEMKSWSASATVLQCLLALASLRRGAHRIDFIRARFDARPHVVRPTEAEGPLSAFFFFFLCFLLGVSTVYSSEQSPRPPSDRFRLLLLLGIQRVLRVLRPLGILLGLRIRQSLRSPRTSDSFGTSESFGTVNFQRPAP